LPNPSFILTNVSSPAIAHARDAQDWQERYKSAFAGLDYRVRMPMRMPFDQVAIYRTGPGESTYIVEITDSNNQAADSVYVSSPLALAEARNLLRHCNLNDTEINSRLRSARTV
jgi:hypothetical protein